MYIKDKIVFVVGAGCTYNEGLEEKGRKNIPPMDKKFFSKYKTELDVDATKIEYHFNNTYGISIFNGEYNSLEKIMVILYTDSYRSRNSFRLFQNLIMLLSKRLIESTNDLNPNPEHSFYQIVERFLKEYEPNDITFITFNQDIQIEKLIDKMSRDEKGQIKKDLLNFPYCYQLDLPDSFVPKKVNPKTEKEFFEKGSKDKSGIDILKLHGSLNWYGFLNEIPSRSKTTLFKKDRKMSIYSNKKLYSRLNKKDGRRKFPSFPMIVPPVTNKSELFHENIGTIWKRAEKKLEEATEVIIIGYSCPPSDNESAYLFKRAFKDNELDLSIIDPDSSVLLKFANITDIERINWYKSSSQYLKMKTS